MRPRTVLHLIDTGGPGGAETVFAELAGGLGGPEWRSIPVVPEDDWLRSHLEARGLDPALEPAAGSFDLGYLRRLVGLIRGRGVDLVQTHLLGSALYGGMAGGLCHVPVVATFHGDVDVRASDRLRGLKFRIIDRFVDRVVFVSETLRERILARSNLDRGRTRVVHNGIDPVFFEPGGPSPGAAFRAELGLGKNELLVGAVGNVRPSKDYPLFLRVAARLRDAASPIRFVVVGDTRHSEYAGLEALRARLGLEEEVRFVGFREDVREVLAALDLYLLTSSAEGFSLTTVQAMAAGLPVVATRCGGPEEILDDGRTGLLVPAGDADAIARAVLELSRRPGRRAELGGAAREEARRRFRRERMLAGYREIYGELLGVRARGPARARIAG